MPLYFTTVFKYKNTYGSFVSKTLAHMNRILEDSDFQRKYVCKHQLIQYYGHIIDPNDIVDADESSIIEYTSQSFDAISSFETANLPVK